ncbi:MAG: ribosome-associated translation inhibitor RaiA [Clostridia bacterium]|nr:ribosome-associated translation inhibitor RaiA [Clostridia bacterium]
MKFNIIGRKMELTDQIRDYATKKLSKLDKFFREESEARVVIGKIKDKQYMETTIYASGMMYRAEVTDDEVLAAIDKTVDIIERQIRKNKTKLEKKIKHDATADNILISGTDYVQEEEEAEFKVIKRKRFQVKPMSEEEAILQMNLLGHNFFVFLNTETDEMNVVYKRKDGNYAVIESIE